MKINTFADSEKTSEATARLIVDTATKSVQSRGQFSIALSGGSSPERTYQLLASPPFKEQMPWPKTRVFWGDERFVPADDPENNARMARKTMLNHVPLAADHIYPIPTEGEPTEAATRYASTLASFFDESPPRFDLILLGLGTNGHTASLFPHTDVLSEKNKLTGTIYLEDKDQHRITLTAPVINAARNIVFLVLGGKKAAMVSNIIQGPHQPAEWPAQLVEPTDGSLSWFLDDAAAEEL